MEVVSVLDMRAAPNLIHQDPVRGLKITPLAPAHKSMGLTDAGGNAFRICRTTVLTVRIVDHMGLVPFLITERLSTHMILACDYIDKHLDPIHPKKGVLYMIN